MDQLPDPNPPQPTRLAAGTRPHHRFWPRRLPLSITPPATSLWDNLQTSARRYPDKAVLVFLADACLMRNCFTKPNA